MTTKTLQWINTISNSNIYYRLFRIISANHLFANEQTHWPYGLDITIYMLGISAGCISLIPIYESCKFRSWSLTPYPGGRLISHWLLFVTRSNKHIIPALYALNNNSAGNFHHHQNLHFTNPLNSPSIANQLISRSHTLPLTLPTLHWGQTFNCELNLLNLTLNPLQVFFRCLNVTDHLAYCWVRYAK